MKFKFDTDWRCCSVLFAKWLKANAIKESTKNEPNIIISIFVFNQDLTDIEYDYYHSMFSQLFLKKQFLSESQLLTYAACVVLAAYARPVLSVHHGSLAPRAQRRLAAVLDSLVCMHGLSIAGAIKAYYLTAT